MDARLVQFWGNIPFAITNLHLVQCRLEVILVSGCSSISLRRALTKFSRSAQTCNSRFYAHASSQSSQKEKCQQLCNCRRWDVLADEDHTNHMSEEEYLFYKNKWWLHLNKLGSDTLPLRKGSDFKQALSTLERLHQKLEKNNSRPFLTGRTNNGSRQSSSSSTWWNGKTLGLLKKNQKVIE